MFDDDDDGDRHIRYHYHSHDVKFPAAKGPPPARVNPPGAAQHPTQSHGRIGVGMPGQRAKNDAAAPCLGQGSKTGSCSLCVPGLCAGTPLEAILQLLLQIVVKNERPSFIVQLLFGGFNV